MDVNQTIKSIEESSVVFSNAVEVVEAVMKNVKKVVSDTGKEIVDEVIDSSKATLAMIEAMIHVVMIDNKIEISDRDMLDMLKTVIKLNKHMM